MTREEFTKIIEADPNAKFEVINAAAFFPVGTVIKLDKDDGTDLPFFTSINFYKGKSISVSLRRLRYINPNEISEIIIW